MSDHSTKCNCQACHDRAITEKERELHLRLSEASRREFLKKAGGLGLTLGIGAGLISPLSASALNDGEGAARSREMFSNKAVKRGKASVMTILHTADIHAQLLAHDEFFIENGTPVYKKRGEFLVKLFADELGLKATAPEGAFYTMLDVRSLGDDIEIAEKCLQNRVVTVPGVAFGQEAKGFLRISFCNTEERMAEGVRRMKDALQS